MSMNSENNKTFDPHRLMLNLTDKMDLQKGDKRVALSDLSGVLKYTWKNIKKSKGNNKLKTSGILIISSRSMKH